MFTQTSETTWGGKLISRGYCPTHDPNEDLESRIQ